jgi:hypothetical protein
MLIGVTADQGLISLTPYYFLMVLAGVAVLVEVAARRSVTVLDAIIFGLFFILVGTTPIGDALRGALVDLGQAMAQR